MGLGTMTPHLPISTQPALVYVWSPSYGSRVVEGERLKSPLNHLLFEACRAEAWEGSGSPRGGLWKLTLLPRPKELEDRGGGTEWVGPGVVQQVLRLLGLSGLLGCY